jgi:hypothetical protein
MLWFSSATSTEFGDGFSHLSNLQMNLVVGSRAHFKLMKLIVEFMNENKHDCASMAQIYRFVDLGGFGALRLKGYLSEAKGYGLVCMY